MNASVRALFPLLERRIDGQPIVYLDSGATSLKPTPVLEAERAYGTQFTANIHRGRHILSQEASVAFENSRRRVARHLGCEPTSVVFVKNTTEGINTIAQGFRWRAGDSVLAFSPEHHSNLVPWMRAVPTHVVLSDPTRPYSLEQVEDELRKRRPRLMAFAFASNVTGVVHPVKELCALARKYDCVTAVDAAQGAAHFPLDVDELGCDFLTFSGHKMLASPGVGGLFGRPERLNALNPLSLGGGTVQTVTVDGYELKPVPDRFEAGTPAIGAVLTLAAALDVLEGIGWDHIRNHETLLANVFAEEFADGLPGARVLLPQGDKKLAIASIAPLSENISPDHLALILSDSHKIMTRSGFHCCQPLFKGLGLKFGALRASAYVYTTEDEIRFFCRTIRTLLSQMVAA